MRKKLKGSVTVFISLSLCMFIMMVLVFDRLCIINSEKERFEIINDCILNSMLGEYSRELLEKYDLYYIDTSYLVGEPDLEKVSERLRYFANLNTESSLSNERRPWGKLHFKEFVISEYNTPCSLSGLDMANQICRYVDDSEHLQELYQEVCDSSKWSEGAENDAFSVFSDIMGRLEGMERPKKYTPDGKEVEVELNNPAQWVYDLCTSDILFIADIDLSGVESALINTTSLTSGRLLDEGLSEADLDKGKDVFYFPEYYVTYLREKMGSYIHRGSNPVLKCEMEYILFGENSDVSNLRKAAENLLAQRFAVNLRDAMSNSSYLDEAVSEVSNYEICVLKPEFVDPLSQSLVIAAAFLSSLSDVHVLLTGGTVNPQKGSLSSSISDVINCQSNFAGGTEGLTYEQYLEYMLLSLNRETLFLRTMDIMEMNMRQSTGNPMFCMDGCIDDVRVISTGDGSGIMEYRLDRKYGFF